MAMAMRRRAIVRRRAESSARLVRDRRPGSAAGLWSVKARPRLHAVRRCSNHLRDAFGPIGRPVRRGDRMRPFHRWRAGKTGRRARFRRERTPRRAAPSGDQTSLGEVGSPGPSAHPPTPPGVPRDVDGGRPGAARRRGRGARLGQLPVGRRLPRPVRDAGLRGRRRPRGGRRSALLDQRRADGGLLPRRRTRDQTRAHDGGAAAPPGRPPPGGRRGRRDGRPRAHLPGDRGNRARRPRLGDPDGDGRRVRARRARARGGAGAERTPAAPARAGDRRRHRVGRRRGVLLRRGGVGGLARRRDRRRRVCRAPPEDPHPGDGDLRRPRGCPLVRDVSRGDPSGARRAWSWVC